MEFVTVRVAALAGALAAGAAGCLSMASNAPEPKTWTVEPRAVPRMAADSDKTIRLGLVSVGAPYDRAAIAVLRADGSVAHDPFNRFSAAPAQLLRTAVAAAFASDGRYAHVLPLASVASTDATAEVQVETLALDCRTAGERKATVALVINVIGRDRRLLLSGSGAGEANAADGNYTVAFSAAVNQALDAALAALGPVRTSEPERERKSR